VRAPRPRLRLGRAARSPVARCPPLAPALSQHSVLLGARVPPFSWRRSGRGQLLLLSSGMAEADAPGAKRARFFSASSCAALAPPPTTTFTWALHGLTLSMFTAATPEDVWYSPEFSACGVRWKLRLEPAKKDAAGARGKHIRLYLELCEPSCTIVLGAAFLSCIPDDYYPEGDEEEEEEAAAEEPALHTLSRSKFSTVKPCPAGFKSVYVCEKFLSYAALANLQHKYLSNGTFVVTATLRPRGLEELVPYSSRKSYLASDWSGLLASGEDSDVTFEAGEETLRAHSLVLSLRSSTLKGLLRSGKAKPCTIKVPAEIEPAVFKQLLAYLYSEDMKLESSEHAQHMLHAADFYGVEPLRSLCSASLRKSLSPANVLTTLTLAHQSSCPVLRSYALRFLAAKAVAVLLTPEWTELTRKHPELSDAVVHTMAHGEPPTAIMSEAAVAAAGSA